MDELFLGDGKPNEELCGKSVMLKRLLSGLHAMKEVIMNPLDGNLSLVEDTGRLLKFTKWICENVHVHAIKVVGGGQQYCSQVVVQPS